MAADPYTPHRPVPAKPVVKSYPTPNLADRIYVVHKDTRAAGYKLPAKGDAYDGPEAQRLKDFVFSTAQPSDQTGWVDHFYLNERANQNDYNFAIDYPYTDVNYPQLTRTYVLLRTDDDEPTADDLDPVYDGRDDDGDEQADRLKLYLIEHKQARLEDPVLDSLFVGVTRAYQRLPSPVITSYQQNEYRQIVTVEDQEVVQEDFPVSSALTEVLKVERTTTAKSKVTTGTVDSVFPDDFHEIEIPDVIPMEFHALIPTVTETEIVEGDAVLPTLSTGDLKKSEQQLTEFTKRDSVTKRALLTLPLTFFDKMLGGLSQGRFGEGFTGVLTISKTLANGFQTIDQGFFITDSEVRNLGDGHSLKITKTIDAFPILRERAIDETHGIVTFIEKRVISPLNASFGPPPGGYTDVHSYDKWRSIQITSRIDLHSIPAPETFASTVDLRLPPTLKQIFVNLADVGGSSITEDDTDRGGHTASASVEAGATGGIGILAIDGYKGPALAKITRRFVMSPPTVAQLAAWGAIPTKILPGSGSVTLVSRHVKFTEAEGDDFFEASNHGELHTQTTDLSGYLTGGFSITNGAASAPAFAAATTSGHSVVLFLPGPVHSLYVNFTSSTPGNINSGDEILIEARPTKMRFGLWMVEIVKAIVP